MIGGDRGGDKANACLNIIQPTKDAYETKGGRLYGTHELILISK